MLGSRLRRLRSDEGGWVLVTAIILTSVMLVMGLSLSAVVDTQAHQSGSERVGDSAFNLAEGALNAESFLVSRSWPTVAPAASSCSTTQSINGNLTTAAPVQSILASSFTARDYTNAAATWKINVCDDNNLSSDTWSDSKLGTAPGYDANNNGKLWIRAQTVVHGRTRAVAAMVNVQRPPVLPVGYSVLGGAFSGQLTYATSQLTSGPLLGSLTTSLLGNHKLVNGGTIGVRCGLSSLCVEGVFSGLSATPLKNLLLANNTEQYGSSSAVSDDVIAGLRADAQRTNTYVSSVAAGASCIPAGANATTVVFVDLVGTGNSPTQYCTINTNASPTYKMVVVATGAVRVQGTGTLTSVLYGVNRQRNTLGDDRNTRACTNLLNNNSNDPCEVIRVESGAHVKGAVFADGATGDVNIYPNYTANPATCATINLTGAIAGLPLGATLVSSTASVCGANQLTLLNSTLATVLVSVQVKILGITSTVSVPIAIANVGNPSTLIDGFVSQIAGPPSPITYDAPTVSAITGYGSSGTVAGTFRAIPPN
jgi:Tfp pilus assembly protein PilX